LTIPSFSNTSDTTYGFRLCLLYVEEFGGAKAVFLLPVPIVNRYNGNRSSFFYIANPPGLVVYNKTLIETMKNIKFISLKNLFRDEVRSEPMVSLNNSIELLALASKLGWRVSLTIFGRQGRTSFRSRQIHNFFNYILRMNRRHGGKYVVSYLKFSQLAIQKALAGQKLGSLREVEPNLSLPRLTSSGLPRYIPLQDRRALLSNSKSIIRFWLTLYAVYRVINIPGNLKLSTITDPFSGNKDNLQRVSRELAALAANSLKMFDKTILKSDPGLLLLETSSSTTKVSWLGIFTDPFRLAKAGLGQVALDYMNALGYSRLLSIWVKIFKYYDIVEKYCYLKSTKAFKKHNYVGQLSRKVEAAGKIRVFAMVDIWTQSLLKPLHSMLSSFLASLPNDGTKDQIASWKRAAKKSECGRSFGYDLSAATDRLPISIQIAILAPIIGEEVANLWSKLLVGRSYYLQYTKEEKAQFGTDGVALRYAVGQPMGALSSFNMLAVTHHFLVQLAYQRTLPFYKRNSILLLFGDLQWYDNYEITGDDLVLFDEEVAREYLSIMEDIGVPINQTKSVIASKPAVEYLKVTTLKGENVSALSWRMLISNNSFMGRINTVYTLLDRDYIGQSGLINWLKDTTCQAIGKGNISITLFAVLTKFWSSGAVSLANVFEAIVDRTDTTKSLKSNIIKGTNEAYLTSLVSSLINKTPLRLRKSVFATDTLHWITEYMKHKIKISVSVFNDSKELSYNVAHYLFPDNKIIQGVDATRYQAMQVTFFNILWDEVFFPLFKRLERPIPYQADLDSIFESTDSMDRYHELKSILDRAQNKVLEIDQVIKKPKFSMNLISLALKASKWRREQQAINDRNRYMKFNTLFSFENTVLNSNIPRTNRYLNDEPLIKNIGDEILDSASRFDAPKGPLNRDNKEYSKLLWEKILKESK